MIVYRHKEILNGEEARQLDFWHMTVVASALFIFLVQIPLTIKYTVMLRRDREKNKHLLKRMYGLIFVNLPIFYISNGRSDKLINEYSKKYLADLSDFELNNFTTIY